MTVDEPETAPDLHEELDKCLRSGNYLVVLVHREDNELQLRRFTQNFSIADFDPAVKLLQKNLRGERVRLIRQDEE